MVNAAVSQPWLNLKGEGLQSGHDHHLRVHVEAQHYDNIELPTHILEAADERQSICRSSHRRNL